MKKIYAALLALVMMIVFVGCGSSQTENNSSTPATSETESTETSSKEPSLALNPLTGEYTLAHEAVGKRPVAIMINNIKVSLPQRGVSQADICYEVLAEGGITRILAIFPDLNKIPDTGSVRSARHYFISLSEAHNSIFVHFGGSPLALQTIKNRGIDSLNGLYLYPTGFYRDQNRVGKIPIEHTVFTDSERLKAAISRKNVNTNGSTPVAYNFGDNSAVMASGSAAANITVPFSSYTKATFTYNSELGVYQKGEFNAPQIDENTGATLAVTNVFVLETDISKLQNSDTNSRIDVDLSSGSGYYACGGKIIPINWKKGDFEDQLKYYTKDGKELTVKNGKSWVCIISKSNTVSYN